MGYLRDRRVFRLLRFPFLVLCRLPPFFLCSARILAISANSCGVNLEVSVAGATVGGGALGVDIGGTLGVDIGGAREADGDGVDNNNGDDSPAPPAAGADCVGSGVDVAVAVFVTVGVTALPYFAFTFC